MNREERLKPESWRWHLLGLVNPLLVITTNMVGGYWVASGLLYMLGAGPLMDLGLGRAKKPSPLSHIDLCVSS